MKSIKILQHKGIHMDGIDNLLSSLDTAMDKVRAEIRDFTDRIEKTKLIKRRLADVKDRFEDEQEWLRRKARNAEDDMARLRHQPRKLPEFCDELCEELSGRQCWQLLDTLEEDQFSVDSKLTELANKIAELNSKLRGMMNQSLNYAEQFAQNIKDIIL